jgi:hypothetical protein
MILYSLHCADGHRFEAWFRNGAAFDTLAAAGEVTCPVCGGTKVAKAPMAPRIGKHSKASRREERPAREAEQPAAATPAVPAPDVPAATGAATEAQISPADLRRALTVLRAHVESSCDYVGDRFPEEARRIHYNETEARPIYGEATPDEAEALQEEGVTFRRIPWLPRGDS